MMGYQAFITALSKEVALGIAMLHEVLGELLIGKQLDINPYMSLVTIREIKKGFNEYLMAHVFGKFTVGYRHTSNSVHPTRLTNASGQALVSIDSAGVGTLPSNDSPPDNYLFNEIFYDSELELNNIKSSIQEVIVYSKIPKSSIRIPLVGGYTYSPDFAYVVKSADGKIALNLVVESKDKSELGLGGDEAQRIKHTEAFFMRMNDKITVHFKKQLQNRSMVDIIKEVIC
jgi:type III restriction enzyme